MLVFLVLSTFAFEATFGAEDRLLQHAFNSKSLTRG